MTLKRTRHFRSAAQQAKFLTMLDTVFRAYGVGDGLPEKLRKAVAAMPRGRFVHRFRINNGSLHDNDVDPDGCRAVIYSDAVLAHVDAAGDALPSSNSQPSYVLYLVHLLGVGEGDTMLEVGSGSGWLASVMAQLSAEVVGIELIPELAAQSRADLTMMDVRNVTIVTGDGTLGLSARAPYDRMIVTAATWDLPVALLEQLADGGRALVPIELRGGIGCAVTVLRKMGDTLVAEASVPGWFVPLLGAGQKRDDDLLATVPEEEPTRRFALPLGPDGGQGQIAATFQAFLSRTVPGFVAFSGKSSEFGIAMAGPRSFALWRHGEVLGFGPPVAADILRHAHDQWLALGTPGDDAFSLTIHRRDAAPDHEAGSWVDRRGSTALAWRLSPKP